VKTFLNGTMPALTNIKVGSFCGTSGAEGRLVLGAAEMVEEGAADVVCRSHDADLGAVGRPLKERLSPRERMPARRSVAEPDAIAADRCGSR
jgi:hypothetical protein